MPLTEPSTLTEIKLYLQNTAEIKQITPGDGFYMVEFVTAVGAAKGIVHCRSTPFKGKVIDADYSPSVRPEDLAAGSELGGTVLGGAGIGYVGSSVADPAAGETDMELKQMESVYDELDLCL
jgi:hypothetical protein